MIFTMRLYLSLQGFNLQITVGKISLVIALCFASLFGDFKELVRDTLVSLLNLLDIFCDIVWRILSMFMVVFSNERARVLLLAWC